jgi:hypothetical protein
MGSGEKWCAAMPDSTADPALQTPDELYGVEGAAPSVNNLMHQVFCPARNIPTILRNKKYFQRKKRELFQLIDCKIRGPQDSIYVKV